MPSNYTKASRRIGSGSYTPAEVDAILKTARPRRRPGVVSVEMSSGPALLLRRRGAAAFVNSGRVTVLVGSGRVDFSAEITIEVVAAPRPHVVVQELSLRPVPRGPAVTARALQAANLGAGIRAAIVALTITEEPAQWVSAATSRADVQPSRRVEFAELEETARLYREAQAAGKPTREYVRRGLAKYLRDSTVSSDMAGNRIRQCRNVRPEPLIPPATSTRPKSEGD